ncbi:MAG TPA: hypothetical protein VJS69_08525 [Candidatus Krumholzibacteria bacterium]|nr:hypothetical protein [Candidatus Krumholzibacteria bacterium]
MMRIFFGRVAPLAMCLGLAATASALAADSFSPSLEAYESSTQAAGSMAVPEAPVHFAGTFALDDADATAAPTAQSYWPLLYSTLIPGLGELTMGYEKRGIALMAAEVVAWTGYYKNHSDGMQERTDYEHYADLHWAESRWIDNFPNLCNNPQTVQDIEECGQASSGSGAWPGYIPYIPKDVDKQHYYENLGKYDWYISGWDDWDPNANPYAHQTDNRTTYRSMRRDSNQSLDHADNFLWLSVAARAFSIAETAIIIHGKRNDADGGGGGGTPISLRARPRGNSGGEVALEVKF